jgi:hypothetical protein
VQRNVFSERIGGGCPWTIFDTPIPALSPTRHGALSLNCKSCSGVYARRFVTALRWHTIILRSPRRNSGYGVRFRGLNRVKVSETDVDSFILLAVRFQLDAPRCLHNYASRRPTRMNTFRKSAACYGASQIPRCARRGLVERRLPRRKVRVQSRHETNSFCCVYHFMFHFRHPCAGNNCSECQPHSGPKPNESGFWLTLFSGYRFQ